MSNVVEETNTESPGPVQTQAEGEVASDSSAGLELLPQIDGADTAAEWQTLLYSLVLLCSSIGIKFWAHEGSIWFTQAEKEDIPTAIAMFCGL